VCFLVAGHSVCLLCASQANGDMPMVFAALAFSCGFNYEQGPVCLLDLLLMSCLTNCVWSPALVVCCSVCALLFPDQHAGCLLWSGVQFNVLYDPSTFSVAFGAPRGVSSSFYLDPMTVIGSMLGGAALCGRATFARWHSHSGVVAAVVMFSPTQTCGCRCAGYMPCVYCVVQVCLCGEQRQGL
jgi:hypothetical protein